MGRFNIGSGYADLRDIVEQGREFLETWQDDSADVEDREEAKAALEDLAELAAQLGYAGAAGTVAYYSGTLESLEGYGNNEPSLVRAEDFEDYAQELADDLGLIDSEARWPVVHIDWKQAANELKADYNEVDFDGESWLIRSV